MKTNKKNSNKGISLVVLVVTIIVIIILAGTTIVTIVYTDIFDKAYAAQRVDDIETLNSALSVVYSEYLIDKNLGEGVLTEGQSIEEYLREQLIAKGVVIPEGIVIKKNGKIVDYGINKGDVAFDEHGKEVLLVNWSNATWNSEIGGFESGTYTGEIINGEIVGNIPAYIRKGNKEGVVKSLYRAFYNITQLTTISNDIVIPTTVESTRCMFMGCSNILTLQKLDTSNVTNMTSMFFRCSNLTTISQLDTSNVTNMQSMFASCSKLTTLPQLVTRNVIDMGSMFYGCINLTTVPQLDTSNATDMSAMFYACSKLTTLPQLDTKNVTNMQSMFSSCSALKTIPQLDTSKVSNIKNILYNNYSLTTLGGFKDLGKAYLTTQTANHANYTLNLSTTTNLTANSLLNVIDNLYDIDARGCERQSFVVGATNMGKLTTQEIETIETKGWDVN